MTPVGQRERLTQDRVIALLRDGLGYTYLGDWTEREDNRNVEPKLLKDHLLRVGYDEETVDRAIFAFERVAGDLGKSIYDRNRAVYDLLRYGVKVRPEAGQNMETV